MTISKKIGITFLICAILLSFSVCFANTLISKVDFEVSDVIDGEARLSKSRYPLKGIRSSETGVYINGIIWTNMDTDSIMKDTDKYEEGVEYKLKLTFVAKDGYEIGNLVASVNGEKVTVDHNEAANRYEVEKIFKAQPRPKTKVIKTVEIRVEQPVEEEVFTDTYEVKTNLSGKFEEQEFGERDNMVSIRCDNAGKKAYTSSFPLYGSIQLPEYYEFDKNMTITLNGEEVEYDYSEDGDMVNFIEWLDPIWTTSVVKYEDHIELEIDPPKVGETPATTAKPITKNTRFIKLEWEPADEKFEAGKSYTVKIWWGFEYDPHLKLAQELTSTINGLEATVAFNSDNGIVRSSPHSILTFPKLEGEIEEVVPEEVVPEEQKKIEWTKASSWAEEELNKANEKELVPTIFEKEDLTTNITRKEFAYVAVKLWESISGQKGDVGTETPFTDCDDPEVLKAYNLGITSGTSETTFSPDTLITREQMATMLKRALEKAGVDTAIDLNKVEKFADDDELHDWGKEAVYYMSNLELIKGVGNNNFGVKGDATREQSLVISLRSVEKLGK